MDNGIFYIGNDESLTSSGTEKRRREEKEGEKWKVCVCVCVCDDPSHEAGGGGGGPSAAIVRVWTVESERTLSCSFCRVVCFSSSDTFFVVRDDEPSRVRVSGHRVACATVGCSLFLPRLRARLRKRPDMLQRRFKVL